jgi:hypothetical protein
MYYITAFKVSKYTSVGNNVSIFRGKYKNKCPISLSRTRKKDQKIKFSGEKKKKKPTSEVQYEIIGK